MRRLTELQLRFINFYKGECAGNGYLSALKAGYKGSDATLRAIASENLTKPNIIHALQEIDKDDPLVADRIERQEFWTRIMRGEELENDLIPSMKDRMKASELLGKTQGDFIDRVEHSGPDGKAIQVESSPEERRARIAELTAMLGVLDDDDA